MFRNSKTIGLRSTENHRNTLYNMHIYIYIYIYTYIYIYLVPKHRKLMKANESTPEIPETALMSQLDPTFQVDFPRLQIVCEGSTPCVTFPSCHQTQLKSCGLWSRYNLRRILEVVAVLNLPAASCHWPASPTNYSTCCQTVRQHTLQASLDHTVRFC